MPPFMFAALSFPMTQLAHTLFPPAMANGVIAGAFSFCELCRVFLIFLAELRLDVLYDCMHYA